MLKYGANTRYQLYTYMRPQSTVYTPIKLSLRKYQLLCSACQRRCAFIYVGGIYAILNFRFLCQASSSASKPVKQRLNKIVGLLSSLRHVDQVSTLVMHGGWSNSCIVLHIPVCMVPPSGTFSGALRSGKRHLAWAGAVEGGYSATREPGVDDHMALNACQCTVTKNGAIKI